MLQAEEPVLDPNKVHYAILHTLFSQLIGSLVEHAIVVEGEKGFKRYGISGKKVTES